MQKKFNFYFALPFFPLYVLITVPKKLAIAVKRNRLKRRIRAALYGILKNLYEEDLQPKEKGLHIAIIIKKAMVSASFENVENMLRVEVQKLIRKSQK